MRPLNSLIGNCLDSLHKVSAIHGWTFKSGTILDIYIANNLLGAYVKYGEFRFALKLFDEIPNKDTVTWNSMIAGYIKYGNLKHAWELQKTMRRLGFSVDGYTFPSILKGIANEGCIHLGQQAHSTIIKMGYAGNVYPASALLDMYAKCDRIDDAFAVFQKMPERNSITWNALIAGYAEKGDIETCFWLLGSMEQEGVKLEDGTFTPLLTLLDDPDLYKLTTQVHSKIIKNGLTFQNTVCNATITSYSDCGSVEDAVKVFDAAVDSKDIVTWNSMLAAYLAYEKVSLAFKLFLEMQYSGFKPDIYTYTGILSACSDESHGKLARSLHALVMKKGVEEITSISNSLIAMYLKTHVENVEDALKIFESMDYRDSVSWNSILNGFSQHGLSEKALELFRQMRYISLDLDHYAVSAVLRCCSDLAILQLGQQVHVVALKFGLELDDFVASSLIFMYSKCGIIDDARKSFDETPKDSPITWNSIIFGYAQHGQGKIALQLFFLMKDKKIKMDHITFVAVLTACSHVGLVDEGYNILKDMESIHGIPPRMEHYACGIDLFGRAGRLEDAKELVEGMPFEPDAMVLKTLLGACKICGDIELATKVASRLLELEPEEHCTYVLLSNMYGHLQKWDDKAIIKRQMRDKGIRKVPGWSWIEVNNKVHAFNAEDCSHISFKDIYWILGVLSVEINKLKTIFMGEIPLST
ncbi:putative pentatricopeptide repeat-containing protein At3g25970 [Impatiens glandulifera]|uniref:putative pentatricopeptide repeat-containing protein At3g25970 n=1 Tax=Impatiens glandulifera TaxID=253017 RepID=UPI001FB135B7|nr:putative pentatricopeptide repeat-containing protein At3g25970 [Impatiens glandulifera]